MPHLDENKILRGPAKLIDYVRTYLNTHHIEADIASTNDGISIHVIGGATKSINYSHEIDNVINRYITKEETDTILHEFFS